MIYKRQSCYKNLKRGSVLWLILGLLALGTIVTVMSLFSSQQKLKTSTDYVLCERALLLANNGADWFISKLKKTPDVNSDGAYDDGPPSTTETGVTIYDVDNNSVNDYNQIFLLGNNFPAAGKCTTDGGKCSIYPTQTADKALIWAVATPASNSYLIYSEAIAGRCKKTVTVKLQKKSGASMGAPIISG